MILYHETHKYFYNKYYLPEKENSVPEAVASVFEHYLQEIPIAVYPTDILAGWYGYENSLPSEIQEGIRQYDDREQLKTAEYFMKLGCPDPYVLLSDIYLTHGAPYDRGHHMLDFRAVLNKGINSYIADVQQRLQDETLSAQQRHYLLAMSRSLKATGIFSGRFATLAKEQADATTNEKDQERLQRIVDACSRVPMEPATDFFEAIQAIALLWSLTAISEHTWCSISIGDFDQFMYPYYCISKKKGISDHEMQMEMVSLFRILDAYNGQDCTLSVGGVDENGKDCSNELSYLVIDTVKQSNLRSPSLVFRLNKNTPKQLFEATLDPILFEKGQPVYYSEEECLRAVMHRGIPKDIARRYQPNNCMGLFIPGKEVALSWGCVFNMHLPLELALNYGAPFSGQFPFRLETQPVLEFKTIDDLYEQYRLYLEEIFKICIAYNRRKMAEGIAQDPNPWISALTPSCIVSGQDRWDDAGADYQSVTVECFSFGITGDALGAIEELVFKKKKYSIEQLIVAAQNNYEGYEDIRQDILKCPKYGTGNAVADARVKRIMSMMADICEASKSGNWQYLPSLHTLTFEIQEGEKYGATMDGRLAGQPFNKNAGPLNTVRTGGPTMVALSAASLEQYRYSGGQPIDLHFDIKDLENKHRCKKIGDLIKTYLSIGGLQLQVNSLSSETLRKAYKNPESYTSLIVRIGGHTRYFNELSDPVRREFVERFEAEEKGRL